MNIYKKSFNSLLAVILVLVVSFISTATVPKTVQTMSDNSISGTIIIDAGHGGFDGGAVASDGTVEKDINLIIATKLKNMLVLSGYDVMMTRESDSSTDTSESNVISDKKKSDMKNRLKLINSNENGIFVSIHLNKFTTSLANGAQVFYSPNHLGSKALGTTIQAVIKSKLQTENERCAKQSTKDTYLLYNAQIPAVIVECGFLSNAAELRLLKTEDYQGKVAFTIFCGISEYYKNQEKLDYGNKN